MYWPGAKIKTVNAGLDKLFTYNACLTFEKAREVITSWAQDYHLLTAWIDEEEDDEQIRHKLF